MKPNAVARALALALMVAGSAGLALVAQPARADAPAAVPAAPKLHAAMRSLWQGHVEATRAYALAVKANAQVLRASDESTGALFDALA